MATSWQQYLTRMLAAHMGDTELSFHAAAFLVRDLDKQYSLSSVMQGVTISSPEELLDAEVVPPKFISAVNKLWVSIGVTPTSSKPKEETQYALEERAAVAYLRLPPKEISNAKLLSSDSKKVRWSASVESGGGWDGIREDIIALDASTQTQWTRYANNASLRSSMVKQFQTWAKENGTYSKSIDGIWGDKSEAAFVSVAPVALRKTTSLDAFRTVLAAIASRFPSNSVSVVIGTVIARDLWLSQDPSRTVAPEPGISPRSVEEPPPSDQQADVPVYSSEETVIIGVDEPEAQISKDPRVSVKNNDGSTEIVHVGAQEEEPGSNWTLYTGLGVLGLTALYFIVRKDREE